MSPKLSFFGEVKEATMQYTEDATEAANYLREAIPLMVKHNIHPNPRNFAVWYAYVSKQNENLNKEIEETIKQHNTCPPQVSADLFRRYIIDDEVDFGEQVQQQLAKMLGRLTNSSENMAQGNDSFQGFLENGMNNLNGNTSQSDLESVISTLLEQTRKTSEITTTFKSEMSKANDEIDQLRLALKDIQEEAALDPLTQIFNRRAFDKEIRRLMQNSGNTSESLYLLIADLDHFKRCNDTYGHVIGDKIIQSFAKILTHVCSETDFAARYGGEEFVVLLPNHSLEKAKEVAEKIRITTERMKIKQRNSDEPIDRVTTSLGIAKFNQNEDSADFINRADSALYQAKEAGRNRVQVADN